MATGLHGATATAQTAEDFFCAEQGRLLTDMEFLERAFAHEVRTGDLPQRYLDLGISGMIDADPGCCAVQREDNPFNEPRDWFTRLLTDPAVRVLIGWDVVPGRSPYHITTYSLTVCGSVTGRMGTPPSAFGSSRER